MDTDENGMPKKYIRTFAGDMKTLQEGGEPELAPLAAGATPEPEPEPQGPPMQQAHFIPPPEPIPAPIQVPEPELATPQPVPVPTPMPEEKPVLPPEPPTSPLETYAGDFSDRMKETGATPMSVLAAEQDAGERPAPKPAEALKRSPRSGLWAVAGGVILIILAGAVAYFAYVYYVASVPPPVVLAPNLLAPIAVDERAQVSGTGEALLGAIAQSVGTPIGTGTVRLLYLEASSTGASVFSALQLPAPDILRRNARAAGSMAGVVVVDGTQSPFFILSVTSYGDTFSGMLAWEPNLPKDLAALFPPYPATTSSTTPTATSAAGFRDEVVSNHDVRVHRDTAGRSVLLYGYWNQSTLVIARDPAAFSTILQRLAAAGNTSGS